MAFTVPVENYVRSPYPSLPESKERYIQEELKKLERTLGTVSGALNDLKDVESQEDDLRAGSGFNSEVSLASAATTDIGGASSLFLLITGTTTITSFGTNYEGPRFLRFEGALTLTHGAALVLPGGANIVTAAGDTCVVVPVAGGWVVNQYRRASRPLDGVVIDRAYAEYTTSAALTATIPHDDTIPQNTEGTQILSVSLTPKSTTSRVRLRFRGMFALSAASNGAAAVFSSASVNALTATTQSVTGADLNFSLSCEHEYTPGTTSPLTFSVRVGPAGAVTMRMNGTPGFGRVFGGVSKATLVVEEIA